ncbi:barstar family protein [Mariniluteicoccus flavus]
MVGRSDHEAGEGLFDLEPGVYRVTADPGGSLVAALEDAGWRTGVVEGAGTKPEVLAAIGRALSFPDYYGRNLDALWDCLTDLAEPTALVWRDWSVLALEHPADFAAIREVLADRTREEPVFALVLDQEDDDE